MSKRERENVVLALKQMEEEGYRYKPVRKNAAVRKRKKLREARKCHGLNGVGEPCGASCLKKGAVIEDVEVSGDFCMFHDPDLPADYWKRNFQAVGTEASSSRSHALRRPLELFSEAMIHAPHLLLEPHLKGLGLEWDEKTQRVVPKTVNGKRAKGAVHVGFSRDGDAKRSRFEDVGLQAKLANDLLDRLYGKARMSMDLAGEASIKLPEIPQTVERGREVAQILAECKATPSLPGDTDDPE